MAYLPTIAPSNTQLSTQVCLKIPTRAWDTCLSFPTTHMVKAFRCTHMFPQRAHTQVTPTHTSSTNMPIWCSPSTTSSRLLFMDTTPQCILISPPSTKVSISLNTKLRTPKQIKSNQAALIIYLRLSLNASRRQKDIIASVNKTISYMISPVVYLVTKIIRSRRWICLGKCSISNLYLDSLARNLVLWLLENKISASAAFRFAQSPSIWVVVLSMSWKAITKTFKTKRSNGAMIISYNPRQSRWIIHLPICNVS